MGAFPGRFAAVCAAAGTLAACASSPAQKPVEMSQLGELGEGPVAPAAPAKVHHIWINPFFRHASYERPSAIKALSSNSPIADICSRPDGKAVLDRDLPGLTERPEYPFFKHMSLQTLKKMSRGKMTDEDIAKVDADLAHLTPTQTASLP